MLHYICEFIIIYNNMIHLGERNYVKNESFPSSSKLTPRTIVEVLSVRAMTPGASPPTPVFSGNTAAYRSVKVFR